MEEYKNNIHVLAVSTSQDSAASLLNACFTNLTSSDNQEWTTKDGDFTIKCYTKYPGTDIHRRNPVNHLDVLLVSCPDGDNFETEIKNYVSARRDQKHKLWINETETSEAGTQSNCEVVAASKVAQIITAYLEELKAFNATYKEFINGENDSIMKSNVNSFLAKLGYTDEDKQTSIAKGIGKKTYEIEGNFDYYTLIYSKSRKFWLSRSELIETYTRLNRKEAEITRFLKGVEKVLNDITSIDSNHLQSTNHGKFEFSPEGLESKGVGFTLDISVGDEFAVQNPILPLIVRDNLATLTIELFSKSPNGVDLILGTLNQVKDMVEGLGLLNQLSDKYGVHLSFSKSETSVYIDLTLGGIIGENITNRIRSLNLDSLKLSFSDVFKIITDINVKDVYENFDLDKIIAKACVLTVFGEGKLTNIRSVCHMVKEVVKYLEGDRIKKDITLGSYAALILSTFENLGLTIKYSSSDVKSSIMDIINTINASEEFYDQTVLGLNQAFSFGILPMVLQTLEGVKGMVGMFGEGLAQLNFDKISLEFLLPGFRTELKASILLPGLTDFVSANLLS